VSHAAITVSVSPARAGITIKQTLTLVANTNDNAGVAWTTSSGGGALSASSSQSGAQVTYTPPAVAGVYTVTATSVSDATHHAAVTVGVTDLTGVHTYHNNLGRDGANTREYALTPASVKTETFGRLFSCPVDAGVWAQPLWVANLGIGGSPHNVIFVATAHNSLYAFDADVSPCMQLWQANLIDVHHGGNSGEISMQATSEDFGVTGTPVIDPQSNTLYA